MIFATTDELAEGWRPLSAAEKVSAEALLGAAGRWITNPKRRPDIAADDPDAKLVSIAVVKNALIAGAHAGYSSFSNALGPRSKSGVLTNPDGALVWLDWMKEQLGISQHGDPQGSFGDGDFRERW